MRGDAWESGAPDQKNPDFGRNFQEMFPKRPQPEELAACGSPDCAGCYEVMDLGDGMEVPVRIHPPRSEF